MSTLIVRENTIFKSQPIDSSKLSDRDKASVTKRELGIKKAEKVGGHYKIVLDNPLEGRTEWYVFEGHVSIVDAATLVVTTDTVFKTKPVQSSDLPESEKYAVTERELGLKSFEDLGNHLKITLLNPLGGRTDWYVFDGHVDVLNVEDYAPPQDPPPAKPEPKGKLIRIAGKGQVGLGDKIIAGGNFTWDEATKGGTRLPENEGITNNIILIAKKLEEVRDRLENRSISITSWYRPPAINRAVGGARNSTHIKGFAVDFNAAGLSPGEVQRRLDPWWPGGLGYGKTFTHLDARNYRARWNYGS